MNGVGAINGRGETQFYEPQLTSRASIENFPANTFVGKLRGRGVSEPIQPGSQPAKKKLASRDHGWLVFVERYFPLRTIDSGESG